MFFLDCEICDQKPNQNNTNHSSLYLATSYTSSTTKNMPYHDSQWTGQAALVHSTRDRQSIVLAKLG